MLQRNNSSTQRESNKPRIIRRKLAANFTTIPNEIFDFGLSLEATSLLIYLLSRSRNWRVIPDQLRDKFGCGRDKIYRLLTELIAAGFLHRSKSADGSIRYTVFDRPTEPLPENQEVGRRNPNPENQEQDPNPEKPDPENQDVLPSTERVPRTDREERAPRKERDAPSALPPLEDAPLRVNGFAEENQARSLPKEGRKPARKKDRTHPLPPEWAPSADDETYGVELGFSPEDIREMAEDMRLWSESNCYTASKDWTATFRKWMRRQADGKRHAWVKPREKGYAELADELRNGGGFEEWDDGEPAYSDGKTIEGEVIESEVVIVPDAGPVYAMAVGHAAATSGAVAVSDRIRGTPVANFDQAQRMRAAILAEARHEVERLARRA